VVGGDPRHATAVRRKRGSGYVSGKRSRGKRFAAVEVEKPDLAPPASIAEEKQPPPVWREPGRSVADSASGVGTDEAVRQRYDADASDVAVVVGIHRRD